MLCPSGKVLNEEQADLLAAVAGCVHAKNDIRSRSFVNGSRSVSNLVIPAILLIYLHVIAILTSLSCT